MGNLRASAFMVLSMGLFALEDVFVKRASGVLPVGQILAMMGLGGALLLAVIGWARGQGVLSRAALSRPVLVRNAAELVGSVGFVTALSLIPISLAAVILQASPLLVTMGAALFLGEAVGWRRWSAIAVGLVGVVLILQPGTEGFRPAALWAVLGVVGLSLRDLVTRLVPAGVTTIQLSAWAFASLVPAGLLTLGPGAAPVMPTPAAWVDLGLALGFGLLGYAAIIVAVRGGDLSVVAPFRYARVVFAMILGALVFAERPDGIMLAGAALIVGSGLYTFAREARLRRRAAGPSPAPSAPL